MQNYQPRSPESGSISRGVSYTVRTWNLLGWWRWRISAHLRPSVGVVRKVIRSLDQDIIGPLWLLAIFGADSITVHISYIYIYVYTWRFPKMVIPLNHPCWSSGWWKDRQGSTGLEPGNDKRLVVFIDAPWHTCFQHIWNAKPGQAPIFFLEWGGKCGKYFPIGFLPKWGILQN